MRMALLVVSVVQILALGVSFGAVEERIIGVLEKTAKEDACAQIIDALGETYYIIKTNEAEKACTALLGKKVELFGVVEERAGDPSYFFHLRRSRGYNKEKDLESEPVQPKPDINVPLPPPSGSSRAGEASKEEGGGGAAVKEKSSTENPTKDDPKERGAKGDGAAP